MAFKRGWKPKTLKPGLHFYWPLVTELETFPVVRQPVKLSRQTLTTKDNITVGVSGVVTYRIRDILAFFTNTYEGDDTIEDIALTSITQVVNRKRLRNGCMRNTTR